MLAVTRFDVDPSEQDSFRDRLEAVRELFLARPGCLEVLVGRNLDDPRLWALTSRWRDVGSYRRALGSYEVKLHGTVVLSRALDEPGAYEEVGPGADLNVADPRSVR